MLHNDTLGLKRLSFNIKYKQKNKINVAGETCCYFLKSKQKTNRN